MPKRNSRKKRPQRAGGPTVIRPGLASAEADLRRLEREQEKKREETQKRIRKFFKSLRKHRRRRTTTKKRSSQRRSMGPGITSKKRLPRIKTTYGSLAEQQRRSAAAWAQQSGKITEGPLKTSRLTQRDAQGNLIGVSSDITVMDIVVSPRGREVTRKGQPIPGAKPPKHMPQSKQDYFLTSRAIRYLAYDFERHILEITFQNQYVYLYYNVDPTLWYAFQNASSKGRFFHHRIYGEWRGPKGSKVYYPEYQYKRVRLNV